MGLIKNIVTEDECFLKGNVFVPLFDCEAEVWIENSVDMAYAEKCAEHLVNLDDKMIDAFCDMAIKYCKFMIEEWGDFSDIYGDISNDINKCIPEDIVRRDILKYISRPHLYVFPPEKDETGYNVECDCVWEPEHGLDLIIRGDRVLYVGQSEGLGAWADDEEYEWDY